MRYMQIIHAGDLEQARRSYLELLSGQGVALPQWSEIYVETVHRPRSDRDTWLCYVAVGRKAA